jgi:hypothetical protein
MNTHIKDNEKIINEKTIKNSALTNESFKSFIAEAEMKLALILVDFYKVRVKVRVQLSGTLVNIFFGEGIYPGLVTIVSRNEQTKMFELSDIKILKGIYSMNNVQEKEVLILAGSLARNPDVYEKKALYFSYKYHKMYNELNQVK